MEEVDWEDLFREIVRESGKTQAEVAEGISTTQPTISSFMIGRSLRVPSFLRLMRYLGYNIWKDEELQP